MDDAAGMTRAQEITEAYRRLAGIRATAEVGAVTATANPHGELLALDIDPRVYRNPDADALARDVPAAVRAAAGRAGRDAVEVAGALLPDHVDRERVDLAFDPALHELDRVIAAPPAGGAAVPEVDYRGLRRDLLALRERLDAARGTATSDDGLVTAVADGRGRLRALTLHPRVLRTADSRALARVITATARAARARVELSR